MDVEQTLSSHNIAFLEALYDAYEQDPESIDPEWRALIEYERARLGGNGHGRSTHAEVLPERRTNGRATAAVMPRVAPDAEQVALQSAVNRLIENYRMLGHLRADLDPLGRSRGAHTEGLDLDYFRLDETLFDRRFHPGRLFDEESVPLRDIVAKLQRTYCRRIGVEYWHITDVEQRSWLRERMEAVENEVIPAAGEQRRLLRSLAQADSVDEFLHTKFIGAKRFSIAGAESVIGLLETLIDEAGELGVDETVIGMAHRGRLSVMMNVIGQTPAEIFSRFEGGDPWESLGSGDVKYHLGCYRELVTTGGKPMYLALAFNPSHLEAITPVLAGRIRASQDRRPRPDRNRVLGVTLHGDAAIMGQGVTAETFNLSRLAGYTNDGTIRVVINNQIGFTTDPHDARSTIYPTAVADMLNVPVFHVNGDDPEAAAYVARLAIEYRQRFHSDVIIDVVCYRKYGHNEGDEPTFTQPKMYDLIKRHPSVRELYQNRLLERGTVTEADCEQMGQELHQAFESALEEVRAKTRSNGRSPMHGVWENYRGGPDSDVPDVETKIDTEVVARISDAITNPPPDFALHPKLARLVKEAKKMYAGEVDLSWSAAEHLAYGSLLLEGHSVRMSGQDVVRGTFTHRHAGWSDVNTGERYIPLQHLGEGQGRFDVYNSPLSEFAVAGFEFGYSLAAPDTLVIWEAQFGDFVNGAQVIIDQFMSSSEDKWNRISGLTMFLPHGYEGQGPEHSSARLERFLQLCAEDNMQVCNLTSPAQMFHVLRRQVLRPWRKPLIIMTPKSLLRSRPSFSPLREFVEGGFRRFIDDEVQAPEKVRRVMACSGKIYYELSAARDAGKHEHVAIVRVEQLYPFPQQAFAEALERYPAATELLWIQEEPQNMGAWTFVRPYLEELTTDRMPVLFVGRDASASPATGSHESHRLEQDLIIQGAFEGL
jgi:2-oxoglutarate dehydrogenase E1 component